MKYFFYLHILLFYSLAAQADFDIGFGTSSFVAGRNIPALAVGFDHREWGVDFRGVGVETKVYEQNASTLGIYKVYLNEALGVGDVMVGAGLGGSYITRAYRETVDGSFRIKTENVGGIYLALRYRISFFYIGADSVLGLSPNSLFQNIVLNFQDMSHFTLGVSL